MFDDVSCFITAVFSGYAFGIGSITAGLGALVLTALFTFKRDWVS